MTTRMKVKVTVKMKMTVKTSTVLACLLVIGGPASGDPPVFVMRKLDGKPTAGSATTKGLFSEYPAEGCCVMDMNGDGKLDIASGAYWYAGPDFDFKERREFREAKRNGFNVDRTGGFVNDFGEYVIDVNRDGAPDIVSGGWFEDGLFWFENPKEPGRMWPKRKICDSAGTEGILLVDVDGDGRPDILPNHYAPKEVFWVEVTPEGGFIRRVVGKHGDVHGIGFGDLNGDRRADIITPEGWYEAPEDRREGTWAWHPEFRLGATGIPIIVRDVNLDGRNDLIYGLGHDYGLFWLEQGGGGGKREWVRHTIDDTWSQVHAMTLADLDGDGEVDLITGKRWRGHGGGDPGAGEPLGVYWYEIDRKRARFTKHVIAYNANAGTGMQIVVVDIDGDGDADIITPGKTGLYLFENRGARAKK